jgi:hypothetical protein
MSSGPVATAGPSLCYARRPHPFRSATVHGPADRYRPEPTTRSDQAKPVARAAFLATRLTPAPVFRTALFADFMAFAVLDFLRFAIFVPLDSRFVSLALFSIGAKPFRPNRHDEAA